MLHEYITFSFPQKSSAFEKHIFDVKISLSPLTNGVSVYNLSNRGQIVDSMA